MAIRRHRHTDDSGNTQELSQGKTRGRKKNGDIRKDTSTVIMNGAIDLFSQKGYTETSMREIALKADIQPGSIYNHYSSKQEILEHILEDYAEFIEENVYKTHAVDELKKGFTMDKWFDCIPLTFPDYDAERLNKMLHIILHEQHRNDMVRQYVVDTMIIKNGRYVKGIIEMLIANGLIEPVDAASVAKLHVAALYFWSNVSLLEANGVSSFTGSNDLREELRFLYSNTIHPKSK